MAMNENKSRKKGFRLRLYHKILGLVVLIILVLGVAVYFSTLITSRRLEKRINEKISVIFDNIFLDIGNIFDKFQRIAEESVRKSSGLVGLDAIKEIAQKTQDKFQAYTQEAISTMGIEVSESGEKLKEVLSEGFDTTLAGTSDVVGKIIDEVQKSENIISEVASFRQEELNQASLDGFRKIDEVLGFLGERLDNLTADFSKKIDDNTINLTNILKELSKGAISQEEALNRIISFQEELKKSIKEEHKKIFEDNKREIRMILGVLKESMRLMNLNMQQDIEKEKVISSHILQDLFENNIAKVVNIQPEAKEKAFKVEKELSQKIKLLNTSLPEKLKAYGEDMRKEMDEKTRQTVSGALSVIEKARSSLVSSRNEAIEDLKKIETSSVDELRKEIRTVGSSTLSMSISTILIIGAISLLIAFLVAWTIVKPTTIMVEVFKRMAKGDLTGKVNIKSTDEIGDLASSFNQFVDQLKATITRILENTDYAFHAAEQFSSASEEVSSSVSQINTTIQEVAQGASLQLDKIREVVNMLASLSEDLAAMAEKAKAAAESSLKSKEEAEEGKEKSTQLIDSINKIAQSVEASFSAIEGLKENSTRIGNIVTTITNFADQTNLLALNAAIEAARAGEVGRGFAVVAEEVRKLAEGSAKAASEISQLVEKITQSVDEAVEIAKRSAEEVSFGKNAVESSGTLQESIAKVADQANEAIMAIAERAPSQLEVARRIENALKAVAETAEKNASHSEEISSSTEEVTAAMEEMSSSAQELAKISNDLKNSVGEFKL